MRRNSLFRKHLQVFFRAAFKPQKRSENAGVQIRKRRRLPNKVGAGQWAEALRRACKLQTPPTTCVSVDQ